LTNREGSADPVAEEVVHYAEQYDAVIAHERVGPWHEHVNSELFSLMRARYPADWFIVADQDELQLYPEPLADIIRFCTTRGYDYVEGCFLDRTTNDGTLCAVDSSLIWKQFPLAGLFTYFVSMGYTKKVTLCRASISLSPGQHSAGAGIRCPFSEVFAQVHHFKWVADVVARLAKRVEKYRRGEWTLVHPGSPAESERFLSYFERNGNRIATEDAHFLFSLCDRGAYDEYLHWPAVVKLVKGAQQLL
jgi:hypothetical protein